ncbi:hypothetical protein RM528_12670 [Streptomyces sp. DSM 41635]|uniref:Uncharacterized protein n=1 Tax=Streptomyces edwardsiae TaxID=3075527 RepID=A0ABU2QFG8_9ACTN|nr:MULTISPECIES: hypothetical protein [unclassified Streptomyces]MDT0398719.1 hypothetical protein [Streptomyces sp. DSM 41636]MDT0402708.1 hypothetical protein [Streptomyces sp. DSM 41635]
MRIRAKAARTGAVRGSSRKRAPAATAIAGLTYVMTEARIGPASLISSRNATNATAVQTTPSAARAARASVEGRTAGRVTIAAGA